MGKVRQLEWLARLRLSKGAAVVALFAILAHAILPVGWMPVFAASPSQGLSIIICTSAGVTHVQIGADGKPIEQAPSQGGRHNHQCCPCTGAPQLVPPEHALAIVVPSYAGYALPLSELGPRVSSSFVHTPHSPRAPPLPA
jgi:hypothetical protein